MEAEDLINIGFYHLDHYTIGNNLIYDLGRYRELSISCLGTPNEMMFILQTEADPKEVTDIVCIHNYDYDGYLTLNKIIRL